MPKGRDNKSAFEQASRNSVVLLLQAESQVSWIEDSRWATSLVLQIVGIVKAVHDRIPSSRAVVRRRRTGRPSQWRRTPESTAHRGRDGGSGDISAAPIIWQFR